MADRGVLDYVEFPRGYRDESETMLNLSLPTPVAGIRPIAGLLQWPGLARAVDAAGP